jgi:hypothetical protein
MSKTQMIEFGIAVVVVFVGNAAWSKYGTKVMRYLPF